MKLGKEVLWLSESDVASLLDIEEALAGVEEAFRLYGRKEAELPPKIYLDFPRYSGDLRAMPAYLKGDRESAGVKIVNSHAGNPAKGFPAVSGVMVLVDPETGLPRALMAAGTLTAMRTGAAGGVAAKYLAKAGAVRAGLVGVGRQAVSQLAALARVRPVVEARLWGFIPGEAAAFAEREAARFHFPLSPVDRIENACDADVIITTTPSRQPLLRSGWIRPGAHINAIGADAPGKQELETGLLLRSRVFVDDWGQASHGGEINVAVSAGAFGRDHLAGELGAVIAGAAEGRKSADDITIFDSTGLAIQDVAVAAIVVEKALQSKKGQVLSFNG